MKALAPPLLDGRVPGVVAAEVRHHLGWPDEPQDALCEALIAVFACYAERLTQRLNTAPQRQLEAFVDLLQPVQFGATSAHTVLVFKPAARPPGAGALAVVRAGVQVAGPTPCGASNPVIFETLAPLVLCPAQVAQAFVIDAGERRWADATAIGGATGLPGPARLLPAMPVARVVSFAIPDSAVVPAPATLHLQVEITDATAWPEGTVIEWCLRGEKGEQPVLPESDTTAGLSRSGEVVLRDLAFGATTLLGGQRGHWLSCRVTQAQPRGPHRAGQLRSTSIAARRELSAQPIEAAFFGTQALDPSRDFFPLGAQPRFGDVFMAQAPAFAVPGAQISLELRLTNPADAETTPPIPSVGNEHAPTLQWDAWTARGWWPLTLVRDETRGFTRSGLVQFTLPADAQAMKFQGKPGGFVRARLASGDYIVDPKPGSSAAAAAAGTPWLQPQHRPPAIAKLMVAALAQTLATAAPAIVSERALEATCFDPSTSDGIALFAVDAEAPAALYLGLRPNPGSGAISPRLQFVLLRESAAAATLLGAGAGHDTAEDSIAFAPHWQYRSASGWADAKVEALHSELPGQLAVRVEAGGDWQVWGRSTIDSSLFWLRLTDQSDPAALPRLARVQLNAVPAAQQVSIEGEVLGSSSGAPNQVFWLGRGQLLGEPCFEVGEPGPMSEAERQALLDAGGADAVRVVLAVGRLTERNWVRWRRVDDFSESGPLARDYVLDAHGGHVRFGDGRHGRIPPSGPNNLVMRRYRSGGGLAGNSPANTVTQLRSTVRDVESVVQPDAAVGGQDGESPASARGAATAWLRHRGRAVGPDDYEDLACRGAPGVVRARCLAARDLGADPLGRQAAPGCVSLAILPRDAHDPAPHPSPELLASVRAFLQARSPSDAQLRLSAPMYVRLDIEIEIVVRAGAEPSSLARICEDLLTRFLHPVVGGPDGNGWDFGRWPHTSELRAALRGIPGLAEVRQLRQRAVEPCPGAKAAPHALVRAGRCTVHAVD